MMVASEKWNAIIRLGQKEKNAAGMRILATQRPNRLMLSGFDQCAFSWQPSFEDRCLYHLEGEMGRPRTWDIALTLFITRFPSFLMMERIVTIRIQAADYDEPW